MGNHELIIETEDGETFAANVLDFDVNIESKNYGECAVVAKKEHTFEVGVLINTETEEEY